MELARENTDRLSEISRHLQAVHPNYVSRFEELLQRLDEPTGG